MVEVVDDVPDNFGTRTNPANSSQRNSRVVVEHPDGRYSLYVHLRQGGAAVRAGDQVKAGDVLGRVGNAGTAVSPTSISPTSSSTPGAACGRSRPRTRTKIAERQIGDRCSDRPEDYRSEAAPSIPHRDLAAARP